MSRDKFNIQDLLNKGYSLVGDTLIPPDIGKITVGFCKQPITPTEVTEYEQIKPTDVKTEWFIKSKMSVPSKKNSRQNFSNGRSIPSKKHAEYVKITEMQYDVFGIEFRRAVEYYKLKYPLNVEFTFVRATKHSFDYCNACQTCEDIMKDKHDKKGNLIKKGWITDDSADYIKPSFGNYQYDKNNAGVYIKLLLK